MKQNQTRTELLLPDSLVPVKFNVLSLTLQTLLICFPVFVAAVTLSIWTTELADIIFKAIADAYL